MIRIAMIRDDDDNKCDNAGDFQAARTVQPIDDPTSPSMSHALPGFG
jgi:hypothetical protein